MRKTAYALAALCLLTVGHIVSAAISPIPIPPPPNPQQVASAMTDAMQEWKTLGRLQKGTRSRLSRLQPQAVRMLVNGQQQRVCSVDLRTPLILEATWHGPAPGQETHHQTCWSLRLWECDKSWKVKSITQVSLQSPVVSRRRLIRSGWQDCWWNVRWTWTLPASISAGSYVVTVHDGQDCLLLMREIQHDPRGAAAMPTPDNGGWPNGEQRDQVILIP